MLDVEEIKKIIPHRYPFLLIDRIEDMEEGRSAHGVKCVTVNEPWARGHFPNHCVMPGVLIVEAMAQTGAVSILSKEENRGKIAFFSSIKNAKFRKEVRPGDRLDIYMEIIKMRKNFGTGKGLAKIGEEIAAEAEISFFIGD